jgi:hypothetical protein
MFRLVLTIQACSQSDDFLESKQITRYLVHSFSHCKHCLVCRIDWKIWLSRKISVYAVQSLSVRQIVLQTIRLFFSSLTCVCLMPSIFTYLNTSLPAGTHESPNTC